MADTDSPLKQLVSAFITDFAAWLLAEVRSPPLNVELPAETLAADQVFQVTLADGRTLVLHIEFQGRTSQHRWSSYAGVHSPPGTHVPPGPMERGDLVGRELGRSTGPIRSMAWMARPRWRGGIMSSGVRCAMTSCSDGQPCWLSLGKRRSRRQRRC